jgi:hypothetical protein
MSKPAKRFPLHGWAGLGLLIIFWILNWTLNGVHTQWIFFPLWLGYCLLIDALVMMRSGTSLLTRNWKKYIGLFLASAPVWWLFELANLRLNDWSYQGAEIFSTLQFWVWATINFTTVVPAVFGSAELMRSLFPRIMRGPKIQPSKATTTIFFLAGWLMLGLMLAWPKLFFPFLWISLYFILEPVNIWQGNRSLVEWTKNGDWQPIVTLWMGVLLTAFFWEMWNYYSYPKWVYHVPWGNWLHIFEMPLPGYFGYLPFAMELFAIFHFLVGLFGRRKTDYVMKLLED